MANIKAGSKFPTVKWILILVVVVIAIVLIQNTLAHRKSASVVPQDAATVKAIEERIKPLGEVSIAPVMHSVPAVVAAPAADAVPTVAAGAAVPAAVSTTATVATTAIASAEPSPAKTSAANKVGENTYKSICVGCHSTGALGAPKLGDKVAWAPRIAKGIDALYSSALKGKNSMPAKGGNTSLPDADVKATVDYIVAASK